MDDIGWGLDPYGLEAWGSIENESGGNENDSIGFEPTDGVAISPGVYAFEQ